MLRRLAAVVAAIFLLAAAATGSLYVTSLPSGADVWIDGTYAGRTPLVLDALAIGRHTLGMTKAGWTSRQLDAAVEQGQTSFLSTRLTPAAGSARPLPGSILVHGSVLATSVDGVAMAPSNDGSIPAPAGIHQLVVRTQRGRVTRTVQVWPQTRTDVVIQPDVEPGRHSVVAPAEDYLPKSAIAIAGERVVVRYNGHDVTGRIGITTYRVDGRTADYDAGPALIGSKLYLPLELLTLLTRNR
ncbi:MAG: hypothetical protein NVS3B7_02450 [Candidatus Elarobacter sp.]